MKNANLERLITEFKQYLKGLGYSPKALQYYGNTLSRLTIFATEKNAAEYTEKLGHDFLLEKCGATDTVLKCATAPSIPY